MPAETDRSAVLANCEVVALAPTERVPPFTKTLFIPKVAALGLLAIRRPAVTFRSPANNTGVEMVTVPVELVLFNPTVPSKPARFPLMVPFSATMVVDEVRCRWSQ